MKLSVIVPVLNEAARIGRFLDHLEALPGIHERILVDGGSSDGTLEAVRARPAHGTTRLFVASRGRATQMNRGAEAADGDTLLFLHADCSLPDDAAWWVERTLTRPGVVAGAFKTWTVADGSRWAPWLHVADLRSRTTRLPYGDQALFLRRETFERVGRFPEIALMEDLELSMRLGRLGRIERVPASVRVSGRRFLAHPVRDTVLVTVFPLLYRLGVSPAQLKRLYRDVR